MTTSTTTTNETPCCPLEERRKRQKEEEERVIEARISELCPDLADQNPDRLSEADQKRRSEAWFKATVEYMQKGMFSLAQSSAQSYFIFETGDYTEEEYREMAKKARSRGDRKFERKVFSHLRDPVGLARLLVRVVQDKDHFMAGELLEDIGWFMGLKVHVFGHRHAECRVCDRMWPDSDTKHPCPRLCNYLRHDWLSSPPRSTEDD